MLLGAARSARASGGTGGYRGYRAEIRSTGGTAIAAAVETWDERRDRARQPPAGKNLRDRNSAWVGSGSVFQRRQPRPTRSPRRSRPVLAPRPRWARGRSPIGPWLTGPARPLLCFMEFVNEAPCRGTPANPRSPPPAPIEEGAWPLSWRTNQIAGPRCSFTPSSHS